MCLNRTLKLRLLICQFDSATVGALRAVFICVACILHDLCLCCRLFLRLQTCSPLVCFSVLCGEVMLFASYASYTWTFALRGCLPFGWPICVASVCSFPLYFVGLLCLYYFMSACVCVSVSVSVSVSVCVCSHLLL